jgi:pyruvate/2-oxoglutarate dehydrogenase complex dihydrolipoamide acyltransferase (E2) component
MMKMTLLADHRVLAGASAERFLHDLKEGLEQPAGEIRPAGRRRQCP